MVTTIAYGMGVGAVPYTMVGELFTPEHRTLGSCLAQVVRWVNGHEHHLVFRAILISQDPGNLRCHL